MSEWILRFRRSSSSMCVGLAALVGLTGCVVSIDPWVSEDDAMFDPVLVGVWERVDGEDRAVLTQAEDNLYLLVYTNERGTDRYHARLGELGARRILDVWPAEAEDGEERQRDLLMVAGHLLVEVEMVGSDVLSTRTLEVDPIRDAVNAGELALEYTEAEAYVLRSSTATLRAALAPFLGRPGVLDEPTEWRRATAP